MHLLNSTGALIGAKGVNVAGTLYDVTFEGGTCASIFSGCDAASDLRSTMLLKPRQPPRPYSTKSLLIWVSIDSKTCDSTCALA